MYTDSDIYLALAYIRHALPFLFPYEFYNGLICDVYVHYDSYSRPACAHEPVKLPHKCIIAALENLRDGW